jgi:hypothetical protein
MARDIIVRADGRRETGPLHPQGTSKETNLAFDLARRFVTNLKLIILGLGAMLATALVFTVIGNIVMRPGEAEALPLSQALASETATTMVTPEKKSSETPIVRARASQPVMQLTLPTRSLSNTATPTSQATTEPYPPPDDGTPYPFLGTSTSEPYPLPPDSATETAPATTTSTATLVATPVLGSSAVQGRILLQGQVLNDSVVLTLENQDLNTTQQITSPGGEYTIYDLAPSTRGYSVLFSQDINPGLSIDQVVRWGMVRVSPVVAGEMTSLPDLEIGLLGMRPVTPLPEAVLTDQPITPLNPLRFEWTAYYSADQYWIELRSNRISAPVWDSGFISATSVDFNGTLWSGAAIQPGTYWWSVGARVDAQAMTISSPIWEFTLDW